MLYSQISIPFSSRHTYHELLELNKRVRDIPGKQRGSLVKPAGLGTGD